MCRLFHRLFGKKEAPGMTPSQFADMFPEATNPEIWNASILAAWIRFGFTTRNSRAGYLGICGNETGGFTRVRRENMNYSPNRAMQVFGSKRASRCISLCGIGDDGKAFASCIYASMIGNGPQETGDGWAYRGGGIIQLTGRGNYRACGHALGIDLEANPDLLTVDPATSAAAAAWFMAVYRRDILPLLDSDSDADFLAGAELVGHPPDQEATQRRLDYRHRALEVLSA